MAGIAMSTMCRTRSHFRAMLQLCVVVMVLPSSGRCLQAKIYSDLSMGTNYSELGSIFEALDQMLSRLVIQDSQNVERLLIKQQNITDADQHLRNMASILDTREGSMTDVAARVAAERESIESDEHSLRLELASIASELSYIGYLHSSLSDLEAVGEDRVPTRSDVPLLLQRAQARAESRAQEGIRSFKHAFLKNVRPASDLLDGNTAQTPSSSVLLARPYDVQIQVLVRAVQQLEDAIAHRRSDTEQQLLTLYRNVTLALHNHDTASSQLLLAQLRHRHAQIAADAAQADYEQTLLFINVSDSNAVFVRSVIAEIKKHLESIRNLPPELEYSDLQ